MSSRREPMSAARYSAFVDRCNSVRKRIPFGYWIAYDIATLPVVTWAVLHHAWWAMPFVAMWLVACFFDVNEAIVKWALR